MNRIIVIFLTLTIGCNQTDNSSQTVKSEESDTTLITSTVNSSSTQDKIETDGEEPFDDFFDNYTTDSIFQLKRTMFPVEQQYWEIGEEEPTSEMIDESRWTFAAFSYHDSLATRPIDAYTQIINYGTDTTKLVLRGVDNGIYIDYNFVNKDGRWFLVSIHDYSN